MDNPFNRQVIVPNRPKIGDRGLSLQFLDTIADNVELMSRAGLYGMTGLNWHVCKLATGPLKPSGMDATEPTPDTTENVSADVWGRINDGSWADTGEDIELTNRSRGYFYQDSFVQVVQHPQSGEWHIAYPAGDKVIGKTDGSLSPGSTATLSIYKWTGAAWSDTGDNVTIRDVFQWTVSASKFVGAHLWDYQNIWVPYAAEC